MEEDDVPENGTSWLFTVVTAAVALCLNLLYGQVVPAFDAMFKDLGAHLPKFSQALVSTPPVAWIVIGISLSAAILLKNLLVHARVCFLIDVVSLIGCGISLVIIVIALFLPLSSTVQNIK